MKYLIVLTLALFAGLANAKEPINMIAKVEQVSMKIASVALYEDGSVIATTREGKVTQLKLAPSVAQSLIYNTQAAGEGEVITTHQDVVCMMMPNYNELRELSVLTGKGMTLVLSASGCAFPNHTHPKDAYATTLAERLRDELILFGQQAANE